MRAGSNPKRFFTNRRYYPFCIAFSLAPPRLTGSAYGKKIEIEIE
jgi:hypothetical protein